MLSCHLSYDGLNTSTSINFTNDSLLSDSPFQSSLDKQTGLLPLFDSLDCRVEVADASPHSLDQDSLLLAFAHPFHHLAPESLPSKSSLKLHNDC